MTNTVNNKVTSPVLENGQGHIFHVAGADFKITGSHIEAIAETNDLFRTLVSANKAFDINEAGVSFYYDYNSKQSINKIEEGAVENFNAFLQINEKLEFLKETATRLKITGKKGNALTEVNTEIKTTEAALQEAQSNSMVVRFSYIPSAI